MATATTAAHAMLANGTTDLGSVAVLLSEKTFDPIVTTDPERFAFLPIVNRFVENAFAAHAAHPDRLSVLNALARLLIDLNRPQEVALLLDDAIARISDAPRRNPPFSDQEEVLNWTYNTRADARTELGMTAEAAADHAAGAAEAEDGRGNVSQRLNEAAFLLNSQRPQEALDHAQAVEPRLLSPYGRGVRRTIIVCAYAQMEREGEVRTALAEAVAHAAESYLQLQAAARCAGDDDIAAQAFIRRLELLDERRNAVLALQSFAGEPSPERWWNEYPLYQRADVRGAIERYAHMRTYSISRPN
jgi:hypothetical protein